MMDSALITRFDTERKTYDGFSINYLVLKLAIYIHFCIFFSHITRISSYFCTFFSQITRISWYFCIFFSHITRISSYFCTFFSHITRISWYFCIFFSHITRISWHSNLWLCFIFLFLCHMFTKSITRWNVHYNVN